MRDYWSLDNILAESEGCNCTFILNAPGLGHLDPLRANTGNRDLPKGSMLTLPLWLVVPMSRLRLVLPHLPEHFKTGMQNVLRKGAEGARLGDKSQNYFKVGLTMAWLINDDHELAAAVFHGAQHRIRDLIDKSAFGARSEEREAEFIHLLTSDELKIYLAGINANEEFDRWRHGSLHELKPCMDLVPLLNRDNVS